MRMLRLPRSTDLTTVPGRVQLSEICFGCHCVASCRDTNEPHGDSRGFVFVADSADGEFETFPTRSVPDRVAVFPGKRFMFCH